MSLDFLNPDKAPDLVYRGAPHMDLGVCIARGCISRPTPRGYRRRDPDRVRVPMLDAELAELTRHNEDCGYEETFLIPCPTERFEFSSMRRLYGWRYPIGTKNA